MVETARARPGAGRTARSCSHAFAPLAPLSPALRPVIPVTGPRTSLDGLLRYGSRNALATYTAIWSRVTICPGWYVPFGYPPTTVCALQNSTYL
jgi:hypothetical protein